MSTITETTELSEVNLRLRGGALVSREAWSRVITLVDGVPDPTRERGIGPTALTDEELETLLGGTTAGLTAQVADLQAQLSTATADKATAEGALAPMTAARDGLQAQLDAAHATISERDATIHDMQHPPAPTDPVVTSVQARIALQQAGLLEAVQAHMASLPETDSARIYWEYATEFHRSNAMLTSVAAALGLTEQQLDELFAAALQVV